MHFDVIGRVRNTIVPLQHAFLPLFEAVVNSIHATQDRFGGDVNKKGRVDIRIKRTQQTTLRGVVESRRVDPLLAIEVRDNGIGFNDDNLRAFETADTTAKAARGGRGVGRFTWLVVFSLAEIESVCKVNGEYLRRGFRFSASEAGIEAFNESRKAPRRSGTVITLSGVQQRYEEALRKGSDVIIDRLFEHCFNYFILNTCPQIVFTDDADDQPILVNDRATEVRVGEPRTLAVCGEDLVLRHVRRRATADQRHEAHLCANDRVVVSFPLSKVCGLPNGPLSDDNGAFVHHVFVAGDGLDRVVDASRTRLDLPEGRLFADVLNWDALRAAIGANVNEELEGVLEVARREALKRIQRYIKTEQPEYTPLLRHKPDALARLEWSDQPRTMDAHLYRIQQEWDAEVREMQATVEQRLVEDDAEIEEIAEELYRVVSETNEVGQTNLIRYVVKRKAVIELLGRLLSRFKGPALESHIHRIVFPMRKSNDNVGLDEHNLWLIDDSLAFYEYLSSDLPFNRNQASTTDSARRPDILAFKQGDPFQHIAIVEFKRPDRDDENPVLQLAEYAQLLRQGGRIDALGCTLPGVSRNVRIDGYAVVSISEKMERTLQLSPGDLKKVETEWRWYGHLTDLNLSIEVLDFRAFIGRAKNRNRAFFARLGLS